MARRLPALPPVARRLEPLAQVGAAAGGDRARGAALGELVAARLGEVEQLLALLGLARGAQEQPGEQARSSGSSPRPS